MNTTKRLILTLFVALFSLANTITSDAAVYRHYRSLLPIPKQQVYDLAELVVANPDASGTVDFTSAGIATRGNLSELIDSDIMCALQSDHPEYWWWNVCACINTTVRPATVTYTTTLPYAEELIEEDLLTYKANLESVFHKLGKMNNLGVYGKLRKIDKYLAKNYSYHVTNDDATRAIGRVLATKKCCCVGYARLAKLICDNYDIPCVYVTGLSDEGGHAWNHVKVGGKWYLWDATWDDEGDWTDRGHFLTNGDKEHHVLSQAPKLAKKDWHKTIRRAGVEYRLKSWGDATAKRIKKRAKIRDRIKYSGVWFDVY